MYQLSERRERTCTQSPKEFGSAREGVWRVWTGGGGKVRRGEPKVSSGEEERRSVCVTWGESR